ncbi:hypothetical protein JJB07_22165 [Tumebacillus sp. ITR2]|uniref:Secreted protein n=1 Tax=Tumebacillus amylolyticus TaxID=2801339 RepID=A0ABS1JGG0_9BACL|nr:hypothetical protein [Tumebacillus amylolyticus]MBL0389300.1 hypothetical protein [Tumebacillus amylolyticus]
MGFMILAMVGVIFVLLCVAIGKSANGPRPVKHRRSGEDGYLFVDTTPQNDGHHHHHHHSGGHHHHHSGDSGGGDGSD